VRPWIALTTVTVIPFSVILFCNVFIIRALFAFQRLRSEQAIASASDKVGISQLDITSGGISLSAGLGIV